MYFKDADPASESGSDNEQTASGVFTASMKIDDTDLPIRNEKKSILRTIKKNRVTVIVGSTGSGKSTIIPAYLLAQSKSNLVKLAISQPRRIAAVRLAERVASFMINPKEREVGQTVGYGIRGKQAYDPTQTRICYVTTGYFQRVLAYFPHSVTEYSHILLDEVHERSIDSDFLCLIIRTLLTRATNSHVRLVVMSATMQASLYRQYFTAINANVMPHQINLKSGTQFEVTTYYLEDVADMIPDGCLTTLDSALSGFFVATNTSVTGARAEFSDQVRDICIQLILKFASDGHSVLCFLPGHGEMCHVTECLEAELMRRGETVISVIDDMEAYKQLIANSPKHFYEIFSLHGLMPQSQMNQPMGNPPAKSRRIILATNVAESSLTVKGVNVVIDSGLRKVNKYNYQDNFSRLVNTWCSRASITQRQGRTGRICDGISIRLFTREWEQRVLGEYDVPDAALENFSNVLLFAKQLCESWHKSNILTSPRPSLLLDRLLDPPERKYLDAAIRGLHETGLTRGEPDELAPLTIMGILATRLQVDTGVCRIIYYAWMMGMPLEGIVIACACGMDRDVLRYPTKWISGMEEKFARDSRNSLTWRERFDAGSYSEPIAYRNILISWICARLGVQLDHISHPIPPFDPMAVFSSEFEAFRSMCESVAERFETFLSEDLNQHQPDENIKAFRYILNHFSLRTGNSAQDDYMVEYMEHEAPSLVPHLLPATFNQLKLLLSIALNRRIIHADASPKGNDVSNCLSLKMCSVKDEKPIARHILLRREKAFHSLAARVIGEVPEAVYFAPRGDEMKIILQPSPYHVNPLLVPEAARVAIQFFDRKRTQFRLQNDQYMPRQRPTEEDFIFMFRPRPANVVSWNYLTSLRDEDNNLKRASTPIRLNYRNPVGWMLRSMYKLEPTNYWAVSPCLLGISGPTDMYGQSTLMDTRADSVTVLPLEFGGSLSMIYQLISLPFTCGLEAEVEINLDDGSYHIKKIKLEGKYFFVHENFPITSEILSRASAIRDLLLAGTNIGFDKTGSIANSMQQLDYVRMYLPGSMRAFFEYVYSFYDSESANWTDRHESICQTVMLIDHEKSPHIVTDSRMWIVREERSMDVPLWAPNDKPLKMAPCYEPVLLNTDISVPDIVVCNASENNEEYKSPKVFDSSPLSTVATPMQALTPDEILYRMASCGYSADEIRDLCNARGIQGNPETIFQFVNMAETISKDEVHRDVQTAIETIITRKLDSTMDLDVGGCLTITHTITAELGDACHDDKDIVVATDPPTTDAFEDLWKYTMNRAH